MEDNKIIDLESKEDEYRKYLSQHKKDIWNAWRELKLKLNDEYWIDDYVWFELQQRVSVHDQSKYNENEFGKYRQYFYPVFNEDKSKSSFEIGLACHINKNDHHWNHWVLTDVNGTRAISMPEVCVIEMLLDWKAMSYTTGKGVLDYYNENKSNFLLHKDTVALIDFWIKVF